MIALVKGVVFLNRRKVLLLFSRTATYREMSIYPGLRVEHDVSDEL